MGNELTDNISQFSNIMLPLIYVRFKILIIPGSHIEYEYLDYLKVKTTNI